MATVMDVPSRSLVADPTLLDAVVSSVDGCLTMCDAHARCVGMSTVPMRDAATVTGMIGVHGSVSGFITVSMSETVAMSTVSGLLQEQQSRLTSQVVDGVGEIANIIAGGIKKGLAKSSWAFTHVTVPSVIIGQNYHIAYARGLEYFSAAFEYEKDEILTLDDRLMQVAMSLIRL